MLHIAKEKKAENIAEYLLYMWQMEDLLRAVNFDIIRIDEEILADMEDEELRNANLVWFSKLAKDMISEKVEVSGHHHETAEILGELLLVQQTMLTTIDDKSFKNAYAEAKTYLEEFRLKTDKVPRNDIETALTAIYGVLTLKLAKKTISPETRAAVEKFSSYMRALTRAYHLMLAGKLPMKN